MRCFVRLQDLDVFQHDGAPIRVHILQRVHAFGHPAERDPSGDRRALVVCDARHDLKLDLLLPPLDNDLPHNLRGVHRGWFHRNGL